MRIELTQEIKTVQALTVPLGSCFLARNSTPFMRVGRLSSATTILNCIEAVDLKLGDITTFANSDQVTPIALKVVSDS